MLLNIYRCLLQWGSRLSFVSLCPSLGSFQWPVLVRRAMARVVYRPSPHRQLLYCTWAPCSDVRTGGWLRASHRGIGPCPRGSGTSVDGGSGSSPIAGRGDTAHKAACTQAPNCRADGTRPWPQWGTCNRRGGERDTERQRGKLPLTNLAHLCYPKVQGARLSVLGCGDRR